MITVWELPKIYTRHGVLTSDKLITNKRKGKPAQHPQPTTENICCYCNRPGTIRVRWFYVCPDHAPAWGIVDVNRYTRRIKSASAPSPARIA